MRRRLSGLEGNHVLNGLIKALAAAGVMTLALWGWMRVTEGTSAWLTALGGIAAGGLVYLLMLMVMRVPEVKMAFDGIKRRIKKQS